MKHILTTAIALASAGLCMAQAPSMSGYNKMKIDHAGQVTGNFQGAIQEMIGDVRIELLSDDAAQGNLPIAADSIKFEWVEGSSQPKKIILTGNVRIKHPDADVTAEKAEWNFENGELVFTGSPVMNSPQAQNMRGDKMTLNMAKGTFVVTGVSLPSLDLNSMGGLGGISGGGGPLSESDIADWPGLVNALKAGGGAAGHITSMIEPGNRKRLLETPTDLVVENKGMLLKQLNSLLSQPGFYNPTAWGSATVPEETATKLTQKDLPPNELPPNNTIAFKAAFAPYVTQ
jgi:hypothetical protein